MALPRPYSRLSRSSSPVPILRRAIATTMVRRTSGICKSTVVGWVCWRPMVLAVTSCSTPASARMSGRGYLRKTLVVSVTAGMRSEHITPARQGGARPMPAGSPRRSCHGDPEIHCRSSAHGLDLGWMYKHPSDKSDAKSARQHRLD